MEMEAHLWEYMSSDDNPKHLKYIRWNNFLDQATREQLDSFYTYLKAVPSWDNDAARLRIDLADELGYAPEIFHALQNGHSWLVQAALKCDWVFEASSPLLDVDLELLIQLLYDVTHGCRLRIIGKISHQLINDEDELLAREVFQTIQQHFGLSSALPLLPCCPIGFILRIFETDDESFRLTVRQMFRIARKDPLVMKSYLTSEFEDGEEVSSEFHPILKFLLMNSPIVFFQLYMEHAGQLQQFKIGRKLQRTMKRRFNREIRKYPQLFSQLLLRGPARQRRQHTAPLVAPPLPAPVSQPESVQSQICQLQLIQRRLDRLRRNVIIVVNIMLVILVGTCSYLYWSTYTGDERDISPSGVAALFVWLVCFMNLILRVKP